MQYTVYDTCKTAFVFIIFIFIVTFAFIVTVLNI